MDSFIKNARQNTASILLVSTIGLFATFNKYYIEIHLVTLCWALYIGIAALKLLSPASRSQLPGDRISILMLLYIAFLILIYFFSTTLFYSFFSSWEATVLPITFLLWRMLQGQEKNPWDIGWNIILCMGLFFSVWGLFDLRNPQATWISGPRVEPNAYADLILCVIIPASIIYLLGMHKGMLIRFYEVAIASMAIALLLTDSRGAILIWCVLTLLMLIFLFRHKLLHHFRLLKLIALYIVCFGIYLIIAPDDQYNFSSLSGQILSDSSSDWSVRFNLWKSALDIYQLAPLTGTGLGSFRIYYSAFRSPDEMTTSGIMAHNDFIQMLVEGGPLSLGFMLIFLSIVAYYLIRLLLLSPLSHPPPQQAIKFSLLLVLFGLATHALINFSLILPVFGAYFGIYLAQATQPTKPEYLNLKPKYKKLVIIIAISLWLLLAIDTIFRVTFKRDNTTIISKLDISNQIKIANFASSIRPNNMDVHYFIIDKLQNLYWTTNQPNIRKKIDQKIIAEFYLLMSSCTACADPHLNLGKFYLATERLDKAEVQIKLAVKKQPTFIPNYINLAKVLGQLGRYQEAVSLLMNDAQTWLVFSSEYYNTRHDIPLYKTALQLANEYGNSLDRRVIGELLLHADPGNNLADETLNTLND